MTQEKLAELGIRMVSRNYGGHLIFTLISPESDREQEAVAEWWSSTGRLVMNKKWKRARFVYQEDRAMQEVMTWFIQLTSRRIKRPAYQERLDQIV